MKIEKLLLDVFGYVDPEAREKINEIIEVLNSIQEKGG